MAALPVDLLADEHLIKRLHRHGVFLLTKLLGAVIFGAVPAVILLFLSVAGGLILLMVAVIWALAALVAAYFIWYRYEHDEWIITDQRLIDSEKQDWFDQQLVSTDLIQIEDMSVKKHGLLQTLFDYGDLRCETAGEHARFILHGIPDPSGVLDVVDTARDDARRKLANIPGVLQRA
jgi:uncharacterized membrane protein YdbT with pleckstrin-like domain